MNYEKNYNVGNIRLDTPYTHFVYELPLLSFGDVLHTVNLSLVYQSKMSGNPYSIAPGFGLNLQKRLVSYDNVAYGYECGNGEGVKLNNCNGKFVFDDGSQRIIRSVNGNFVLENPDYSTEVYRESAVNSHNIISANDKYGNKIFSYTYIDNYQISSISYRPDVTNKKISFAYNDSGNLESISYLLGTQVICTTNLVYLENGGIKVQHYSGVDYYIIPTETSFTVYSRDYGVTESKSYYHSIECDISTDVSGNKAIVANSLVGTSVVDSVTYNFLSPINGKINVLDVTNFHGVTTRTQFKDDKPLYSFEVLEDQFDEYEGANGIFIGNVSIHSDGEIAGKQTVLDGIKMENVGYNHFKKEFGNGEMTAGNFLLSGWVMGTEEATSCNIEVRDSFYPEFKYIYPMQDLPPYTWVYFSFVFRATNPRELLGLVDMPLHKIMTNDFRLSLIEPITAYEPYHDNLTKIYDILIDSSGSESIEIPFTKGFSFYIGSSETSIGQIITAKDILRYKINKAFGTHKNEIYYNDCKGVISTNEPLNIKYDDQTGERVTKNITDLEIGKKYCLHSNSYVTSTKTVDNSELVTSIWQGGKAKRQTFYNPKLDVFSIVENNNNGVFSGNAIYYTRDVSTGLITKESKWDYSTQQTVDTFAEYDDDCTELLTITDEFGVVTKYTTDPTWGVVTKTVLRNQDNTADEFIVTDTFDADLDTQLGRNFTKDGLNKKAHGFDYDYGRLSALTDGVLNYTFAYSDAGDLSQVMKNNILLQSHTVSENRQTFTTNYGSHSVTENYDKYGRLTEISGQIQNEYDINPTASGDAFSTVGKDNADAKLSKSTDLVTGNVTKYAYEKDRVSRIGVFNSDNTQIERETFGYDSIGRITSSAFTYDNMSKSVQSDITYATEEDSPVADSRVSVCSYKVNGTEKANTLNRYNDSYKRLTAKLVSIGGYTYDKGFTYNKTRISRIMDVKNGSTFHNVSYGYDAMGRITSESDSTDTSFNNTYVYDDFGQLIRENNKSLDKTFVYVYDNIGNITSVKTYGYTTGVISGDPTSEDNFTYHSTVKDRLTKFNNISISYNSNGCLSYYDKNYAWTKGKLSRIYKGSAHQPGSLYEDCVFTYDAYGRRLSKSYTRDPNTSSTSDYSYTYNTNYTYDNSGRLIRERCVEAYTYSGGGTNTRDITYLYDESGIVGAIQKLGSTEETFYFDRNIKGDVIGIFNSSGTKVASYSYDAWGNCTTKTLVSNNFSSYNPIRYRGYYYDRETKLYYLNARYYNPEWRRFISPDSTDYIDPDVPNGLNLYAYCGNDPVNYADPSGHLTIDIVLDCFFAANSLKDLIFNPSLENLGRAALDLACLVIPVVTGMGTAITKFDDIKDIASFISKNDEVIVLGQSMNTRIIPLATTIGASFYGGLDDYLLFEKRYGSVIASLIGYSDNMIYIMMNSLSGAKFIDYGFDASRTLSKAIDEGKLFGEIMSRFTIYSERIFARLFRRKNILRILERFRN